MDFTRQKKEIIYQSLFKVKPKLKEHFMGSMPTVFIGRVGYPNINVGMLSPGEVSDSAWLHDAPKHWGNHNFSIPKIVDLRAGLINSRFKAHIKTSPRMVALTQEVGMASDSPEVEIQLDKVPKVGFSMYSYLAPSGPNALLKHATLASNPKVAVKVEKVVGDSDWKAGKAIHYLYKNGFDENFLTKLLSVGNIGLKINRRLVPTRWSITATDDLIGKQLIEEIKNYGSAECSAYFGGYQGNFYVILLFPGVWSYELFELSVGERPRAQMTAHSSKMENNKPITYTTDHEFYQGRKSYADDTVGGYYAARLAILEGLQNRKQQAGVLAIRFTTPDYFLPLGVWVVREAARNAMRNKPLFTSSIDGLLNFALDKAKYAFNVDLTFVLKESKLLNYLKNQRRLTAYQ